MSVKCLKQSGCNAARSETMDFTRIAPTDRQHIQKYGPAGFVVSGESYEGPVLVFFQETVTWSAVMPDQLTLEHFQPIVDRAADVDLCLLGCGDRMQPVASDIKTHLKSHGIGIETMDTGAACRTFNVLLAEGRALVAALFPTQAGR